MAGERIKNVRCPGVVSFVDKSQKPPRNGVRLLKECEPVMATVKRGEFGVVSVDCPYIDRGRACKRNWEIPLSDQSTRSAICRYVPAAAYESFEVAVQPFEQIHFYQSIWDQLTPEEKTACTNLTTWGLEGVDEGFFRGMCFVHGISNDPESLINGLTECGVLQKMPKREAWREMLEQIKNGEVEDQEILAGDKKKAESYKESVEYELYNYNRTLDRHKDDPRWLETLKAMKRKIDEPFLRFSKGFQLFVNQFTDQWGFPIDFTKPRDTVYETDPDGTIYIVYKDGIRIRSG